MSKSLNKKFTLASMTLLTLSVFGTSGLSVVSAMSDNVTTNSVSSGEVAIYAQSAAGNTSTTQNNANSTTGAQTDTSGNDAGIANN